MITSDLAKEVPGLDLPVYFFHGQYDYTYSYTEAKSYFEQLKEPLKGIFTFKHSAHIDVHRLFNSLHVRDVENK
jgi:hypothetical protein